MATETPPDLNQINLAEALFLECTIQTTDTEDLGVAHRVSGFARPQVHTDFNFNLEERQLGFVFLITCQGVDADGQPVGVSGRFKVHLRFEVANLPELLMQVGETDFPNRPLSYTLLGVAYSTARGMILSKVSDTVLQGLSLPLRSVQSLFEEALAATTQEPAPLSEKKRVPRKKA